MRSEILERQRGEKRRGSLVTVKNKKEITKKTISEGVRVK